MTAILNIITSFILIFLMFSIVVSGLQEWWAQFFGQRGQFLRMGMQRLIGDDAIFVRVIQHPLVGSLYPDRAARGKPPSYIEPANFALAFADIVLRRAQGASHASTDAMQGGAPALTYDSLHEAVVKLRLQHSAAALAVLPIIESSESDLNVALEGIEQWFTNGMDRVTGWYKAHAQRRLFAWGLVVACLCNVDTIEIYYALNRSPALSADLSTVAASLVQSGSIDGVAMKDHSATFTPEETKAVMDAVLAKSPPALPIGYACLGAVAQVDAMKPDNGKPASTKADATKAKSVTTTDKTESDQAAADKEVAEKAEAAKEASGNAGASDGQSIRNTIEQCGAEIKGRLHKTSFIGLLLQVLGWSLTALAGVLGAPYWFGLLSQVINIRGSGPKPAEKKDNDKK